METRSTGRIPSGTPEPEPDRRPAWVRRTISSGPIVADRPTV